jgi:hypothetical protein
VKNLEKKKKRKSIILQQFANKRESVRNSRFKTGTKMRRVYEKMSGWIKVSA